MTTGQALDILDRALLEAQRSRREQGDAYTVLLRQIDAIRAVAEHQRQHLIKIDDAITELEHKRFIRDYPHA